MPQAAEQHTVLRFPTKRKRAYVSTFDPREGLPEGVVSLRSRRRTELPDLPERELLLALISTLSLEQFQAAAWFLRERETGSTSAARYWLAALWGAN